MALSPESKCCEGSVQALANLGQAVFNRQGLVGDRSRDQPFLFEIAKLVGQYLLADAFEASTQLAESQGSVVERADYQNRPPRRHQIEQGTGWAICCVHVEFGHRRRASLKNSQFRLLVTNKYLVVKRNRMMQRCQSRESSERE